MSFIASTDSWTRSASAASFVGLVRRRLPAFGFGAMLVLLPLVMALAAPISHDEDQYLGAALLVPRLAIYRDFASLQTPLHAFLFAPLGLLRPHAFLAMRVATALIAALLLGAVYAVQRGQGVSPRSAATATGLLLCCTGFQIGASLVRNDALPALLTTLALGAGLHAGRARGLPAALLSGCCVGLAISAKVSYAPFAPALCLALLFSRKPRGLLVATVAACGIVVGLLPTLIASVRAPAAFWWEVVEFGRSAPFQFYHDHGDDFWLSAAGKLTRLTLGALEGPAFAALAILSLTTRRTAAAPTDRGPGMILAFILAGAVAVWIPTPSWRQYLLPLLPPLFVALGLWLDRRPPPRDRRVLALLAIFAAIGAVRPAYDTLRMIEAGSPITGNEARAREIDAALSSAGVHGPIASASIHAIIDGLHDADPRLSTGVFVLRTHDLLTPARARLFGTATRQMLATQFDAAPPGAILTGLDTSSQAAGPAQDASLARYARSRGYREHRLAGGGLLFVR